MPPDLRSNVFRLDDWVVDPTLDTLERGGETVKLEPRTMAVLVYLAERAGRLVRSEELESEVWSDVVVTSQSVYQSIAQLRKQLGDDARNPRYIATVPRKGYRLLAAVAAVAATEPPASVPLQAAPNAPAPEPGQGPKRGRRLGLVAGVVALLALLGIGGERLWIIKSSSASTQLAIAVLPFSDLSVAHDGGSFCDGLTEELTSSLADVRELRVIARDSAALFRDHRPDARTLGRLLRVTHLLEGSVRREGERLRVTASLVDVRTGTQIWSRTLERSSHELLRVQEDVARSVVAALKLRLSPTSRERLANTRGTSVSAYELYVLGRLQQLQRRPEALERAVAYQRDALAQDPDFALAYAGLADAYMAGYYYRARALADTAPLVEEAVAQALHRDPNLAEAYAARGVLRTEQNRLDEAIADLRKAIILKPNYSEALIRLGAAYEYRGRPREALAVDDQALELDPLHFVLQQRRCLVLQNLARFQEADKACTRTIELQPDNPNGYWTLALERLARGDAPGAISGYRAALQRAPWRSDLQSQLGWLELDVGLEPRGLADTEAAWTRANGDRVSLALDRELVRSVRASGAEITAAVREIDFGATPDPQALADAALLELRAGDREAAENFAARAVAVGASPQAPSLDGVWQTRWGRSGTLSLALCALAEGDEATARRRLAQLGGWLDYLEANGQVWAGLHYLRASKLSLETKPAAAFAELEHAVRLGWRRTWWMRVDPALRPLQSDARWNGLLQRIDAANAADRARLNGSGA